MRKWITFILILAVALGFLIPGAADAKLQKFEAAVYAWRSGSEPIIGNMTKRVSTDITYEVLAVGTDTRETLYSDQQLTSKTNPITTTVYNTDNGVAFWVDPTDATSDTYVDLIVTDVNGGYSIVIDNFSPSMRTIIIDERPNIVHHGIIRFSGGSSGGVGVETDTGIDFEADTSIHAVMLETVTVATSGTYDVGLLSSETSGDADGFIIGVATSTAGYTVLAAGTMGALLDDGTSQLIHVVTGTKAKSLTYKQLAGTVTTSAGYIHYWFSRLR